MTTVADLNERELIARIRAGLAAHLPTSPDWLVVGIGDDAAVIEAERNRLEVITVDAIVEGVHFDRRFAPPEAIGHRALAVNLSDLAAMGATPRMALLSLALPPTLPVSEFERLIDGLARLAARHHLHVVGGNLTRSPGREMPLMMDVTVTGSIKRRQALVRSGAKPGDEVYVSGSIGGSAAGLRMLQQQLQVGEALAAVDPSCVERYLKPEPRIRLGQLLARSRAASACMDLSDGLADGAHQLAEASSVGMVIDAAALPIEPAAREWFAAQAGQGTGADTVQLLASDDYELIFTARPRLRGRLRHVIQHSDVRVTKIGVCTADRRVVLRTTADSSAVDADLPRGFTHFGRT